MVEVDKKGGKVQGYIMNRKKIEKMIQAKEKNKKKLVQPELL
jgi:hypothetical protein